MTKSLFDQATDPKQYDLEGLYWKEIGAAKSPVRQFFIEYLFGEIEPQGKDALDVGSGTGWLLEEMRNMKAKSVTGIEPSEKNVKTAHETYPEVNIILSSLENYNPDEQYDIITSVMVMGHIADVNAAMGKMANLLKSSGELHLVIPPYEYTRKPRFGYKIEIEPLNENEYAAAVTRSIGTIVDVLRKTSVYEKAGEAVGLNVIQ